MRILIEEYQYDVADVRDVLQGIDVLENIEGKVSIHYVGYYYNALLDDCVFILPKVLLRDVDGEELAFGKYSPKTLANPEGQEMLTKEEKDFLYGFAVWIYRAIVVYKNGKDNDTTIIYQKKINQIGRGNKRKSNTFLDILLSLVQFNKDNKSFFFFVLKNLHAGFNKINWTRTISTTTAIIQGGSAIYLNPVNKKRTINFDEELLVIFFSILNYIGDKYGFQKDIDCNFDLIQGKQFEKYLNGYGKIRLNQIKYKYFSDKALQLWKLCYAFFDKSRQIYVNTSQKEYLLVKSFHIVFEAIIDTLVGDSPLPDGMDKKQEDGKIVDHLFTAKSLIEGESANTYYIGDSKYYKMGNELGRESVYKQYTYARNVIQWNLDIFNNGREPQSGIKLRDDATEGYSIIPNFFISATMDDKLRYNVDGIRETDRKNNRYMSRQFENRLFDRDTFLLAHYDVNFLFVVALYGRNHSASKAQWRSKVRQMFRKEIQQMLKENFEFYAMTAKSDVNPDVYIKENFQKLLGKVYHPFDNREGSDQQYFSLALRKPEKEKEYYEKVVKNPALGEKMMKAIADENEAVMFGLRQAFYIAKCPLGVDPRTLPEDEMPIVEPRPHDVIPKQFLTMHYLENYPKATFLIGVVNGYEHLNWIFSRNGGKRDDAYNVRLGKDVHGGVVKSRDYVKHAKFVILYMDGEKKVYKAFRVKNTGELTREQMISQGYLNPRHERYFCYFFDEEITLGEFDIEAVVEAEKARNAEYAKGMPVYMSGEELIKFRR